MEDCVFVHFPNPKPGTKFIPTVHSQTSLGLITRGFSSSNCFLLTPTVNIGSERRCTNKDFLELHYTSQNFESNNFTVIHNNDEFTKSYEILTRWLFNFAGVFDKSAKAVQAKARQVDLQYLKLLKCLRSRSNVRNADKLYTFLHKQFDWHFSVLVAGDKNRNNLSPVSNILSTLASVIPSEPTSNIPSTQTDMTSEPASNILSESASDTLSTPPSDFLSSDDSPSPVLDIPPTQSSDIMSASVLAFCPSPLVLRTGKTLHTKFNIKQSNSPTDKQITRLQDENEQLKRVANVRTRDVLKENISLQSTNKTLRNALSTMQNAVENNLKAAKQKSKQSISKQVYHKVVTDLTDKAASLTKELVRKEIQLEGCEDEIGMLKEKLDMSRKKGRNAKEMVKRRDRHIGGLQSAHEQLKVDMSSAELYFHGIVGELEAQVKNGMASLQEKTNLIEGMETLETKDKGIYRPEIRLVYYDLLSRGVPCNIVQDVVRTVLQMTPVITEHVHLPSRSSAQRMISEAGYLCNVRLAVEKARRGGMMAHQSDGTTKIQLHWLSHVIRLERNEGESLSDSTFTLSVQPAISSTSADTVSSLQEHLAKLEDIASSLDIDYDETEYQISNIGARMSDRANTETAVTKLMIKEKEKLLQGSEDWHSISDEERQQRIHIHAWTCGNHKVNNMAEAMTAASAEFVKMATGTADSDSNNFRKMSSAKQHIYECDKLLCQRSRKEYAKGVDFKGYSLSVNKDTASDLFRPIVGGRYLVFLYNAIPTVCGKDDIIPFLELLRDQKTTPMFNKIEQSVYSGFFDKHVTAEECAFAIAYYDICNPLMCEVKKVSLPLSVDPFYKITINKMTEWSTDAALLLIGTEIWPNVHKKDRHLHQYMEQVCKIAAEESDIVKNILQVMCKAGCDKLISHAKEHLLDEEPTQSALKAGRVLGEAHNDVLESKFGMLDRHLEFSPFSNFFNAGCFVQAKSDKAHLWAHKQPRELRDAAVILSRREATKERVAAGTRVAQISQLYTATSEKKNIIVEKRRALREKRAEQTSLKASKYGTCTTADDVQMLLESVGKSEGIKALKFQIKQASDLFPKQTAALEKQLF